MSTKSIEKLQAKLDASNAKSKELRREIAAAKKREKREAERRARAERQRLALTVLDFIEASRLTYDGVPLVDYAVRRMQQDAAAPGDSPNPQEQPQG